MSHDQSADARQLIEHRSVGSPLAVPEIDAMIGRMARYGVAHGPTSVRPDRVGQGGEKICRQARVEFQTGARRHGTVNHDGFDSLVREVGFRPPRLTFILISMAEVSD